MAKPIFPFAHAYSLKKKYVTIWGAFRNGEIKVHRDRLLDFAQSLKRTHRIFQSAARSQAKASSLPCESLKKEKQRPAPVRRSKRAGTRPENKPRSRE